MNNIAHSLRFFGILNFDRLLMVFKIKNKKNARNDDLYRNVNELSHAFSKGCQNYLTPYF